MGVAFIGPEIFTLPLRSPPRKDGEPASGEAARSGNEAAVGEPELPDAAAKTMTSSLSSSLPSSSPLEVAGQGLVAFRPGSKFGHHADIER